MKRSLNTLKVWIFVLVITILYGTCFTLSEFLDYEFAGIRDFLINISQWIFVVIMSTGFFYVLTLNRYVFSFVFSVLCFISAILTFYRYTLGVSLTPQLIELAFINDARTNMQVVGWELILVLLLLMIIIGTLIFIRFKYIKITKIWLHASLAIILFTVPFTQSRFWSPIMMRLPFSIYHNLNEYNKSKAKTLENRNTYDNIYCESHADTLDVVFVIGESLRTSNMQLNGYARANMPLLSADTAIVSLPNIYTEHFYTHISVPHILTRLDSLNTEAAYEEQSFITLFKKAGFYCTWIANQEPVDTYSYFMNEGDTLIYVNRTKSVYTYNEWLDEDILEPYRNIINKNHGKNLIVLHTIGSHWWYNAHYTSEFEKYKPVVKTRIASNCTNGGCLTIKVGQSLFNVQKLNDLSSIRFTNEFCCINA